MIHAIVVCFSERSHYLTLYWYIVNNKHILNCYQKTPYLSENHVFEIMVCKILAFLFGPGKALVFDRLLNLLKDRAHLSTFKFFILEKFSCIVVLIVFFVIVQSSGLTSVWFREKMTFFLNFISFHIFAIYVGGACWGLPAACGLIAVSGARLPSVDGLTVRYIKMHHY